MLNGQVINDQKIAIAALEIAEIFLSADSNTLTSEGLDLLHAELRRSSPFSSAANHDITASNRDSFYYDFIQENTLMYEFLHPHGLMSHRNSLIELRLRNSISEIPSEQISVGLAMKRSDFYLNANVLLAIAKRYFTVSQAMILYNDEVVKMLVTPNGLIALGKGYITLNTFVQLKAMLPDDFNDNKALLLIQSLLTDTSMDAFANGLISTADLENVPVSIQYYGSSLQLSDVLLALFTEGGLILIQDLEVDLNEANNEQEWQALLVRLNTHVSLNPQLYFKPSLNF